MPYLCSQSSTYGCSKHRAVAHLHLTLLAPYILVLLIQAESKFSSCRIFSTEQPQAWPQSTLALGRPLDQRVP